MLPSLLGLRLQSPNLDGDNDFSERDIDDVSGRSDAADARRRAGRLRGVYKTRLRNLLYRDELCPICQGESQNGEPTRELPCGHELHEACATRWLEYGSTCPSCNAPIAAPQEEEEEDGGEDRQHDSLVAALGENARLIIEDVARPVAAASDTEIETSRRLVAHIVAQIPIYRTMLSQTVEDLAQDRLRRGLARWGSAGYEFIGPHIAIRANTNENAPSVTERRLRAYVIGHGVWTILARDGWTGQFRLTTTGPCHDLERGSTDVEWIDTPDPATRQLVALLVAATWLFASLGDTPHTNIDFDTSARMYGRTLHDFPRRRPWWNVDFLSWEETETLHGNCVREETLNVRLGGEVV